MSQPAHQHTEPGITKSQSPWIIRTASQSDISQIIAISSSATKKFARIPALSDLAEDEETPARVQSWLDFGPIYLVCDSNTGEIVGFIACHFKDAALYIAEISVHASHQGRGVGGRLINAVKQHALSRAEQGGRHKARVALTTYADVRWNGPWYGKHGFSEVEAEAIGPWYVDKMTEDEEERSLVRPGWRRCCMLWEADAAQTTH